MHTHHASRPPRPVGSSSSSVFSGSSGSFHRERERSPHTPLPPPASMPVPGPMYPVPRTPMMDAHGYRSLFPRRRVAPPTPPSSPTPPPSDDEPSIELEGDPEEPYLVGTHTLVVARCIPLMLPMLRNRRTLVLVLDLLVVIRLTVHRVVVQLDTALSPVDWLVTAHQMMIW
ncbi:hypothetical protein PIB30_040879 [Stylosanthes scabra]|uniref:Uncharacterized protein n=1 Tax=Stylosanthes scabra TaxID=79078 RepID=A0ABU6TEF2_9FABA|nr:hypothetical protein [Stylosanthes scabra]